MNRTLKTVVFWAVIVVSAMLLWQSVRATPLGGSQSPEISYSRFMSDVEAGNVESVVITGTKIMGHYHGSGGTFHLTGPANPGLFLDVLRSKNVEIRFEDSQSNSLPMQLMGTWAPLVLLGAMWFFMIRQMRMRRPASGGGTERGNASSDSPIVPR